MPTTQISAAARMAIKRNDQEWVERHVAGLRAAAMAHDDPGLDAHADAVETLNQQVNATYIVNHNDRR